MTNDVTEAAKSAILLAQSGDSPRAYEVVATMLTAIVNANKELVNLHKIKQDAAPHGAGAVDGGGVNIEKAVFVGRAVYVIISPIPRCYKSFLVLVANGFLHFFILVWRQKSSRSRAMGIRREPPRDLFVVI